MTIFAFIKYFKLILLWHFRFEIIVLFVLPKWDFL
jgi:hypothetical protein